jgi:uncharacterized protein HemY
VTRRWILASVAYALRELDLAFTRYSQLREILHKLGDESGTACVLHQLGSIEFNKGEYFPASRFFRQSLEIHHRIHDLSGEATALGQLGMIAQAKGDYKAAHEGYLRRRYQSPCGLPQVCDSFPSRT